MKTTKILLLLVILLLLSKSVISQTIYEIQPGTKVNEIKLTVTNISETNPAINVTIKPHPTLSKGEGLQYEPITFHQSEQKIDIIDPKEEKEVTFTFDVNRNAPVNKKDTIDFMITDNSGTSLLKSFIFNYTAPKEFKLEQNFPNPFNPITRIQYQVSSISKVTLKVYDILGSEVATLVNEEQQPGYSKFSSAQQTFRVEFISTGLLLAVMFLQRR